jgi:hypothetical protein
LTWCIEAIAVFGSRHELTNLVGALINHRYRIIGGDQQLASISARGILRDLADRGDTVTLSTVVRFTHPETGKAEVAASLAYAPAIPARTGSR